MKHYLSEFPDQKKMLNLYPKLEILQVNGHIHTPYSFSAFTDVASIFEMAQKENVAVVGINDFNVADGYEAFHNESLKSGVFPLFNIEFIGLLEDAQCNGIRINDPDNPGRCYFSGKGLNYPFKLNDHLDRKLSLVIEKSQGQMKEMIGKVNDWFAKIDCDINLNYIDIKNRFAKELVRERHIARAIKFAVFEKRRNDEEKVALLTTIFNGKAPKSAMSDLPGLENEIRSNLLKAGGVAFVKEDESTFLKLDEVIEIILNAGGIPCYPVLLDDKNGNYTEFEQNPDRLWQELVKRNIGCIELIPGRNDAAELEKFVTFFAQKGFAILFGTEHNSPDLIPLTCDTRGKKALSSEMQRISYEGCCIVASHQYLQAKGAMGFVDNQGYPNLEVRDSFVKLGNAVIHYFRNNIRVGQAN